MKNSLRAFLLADGVPGDLGAFKPLGRALRLYDSGGGQQQQQPTNQTVTNVTVPEYAQPYAESMLGKAAALTDTNANPYQPYQGQMVAGQTGLQQQANTTFGSMTPSGDTGSAISATQQLSQNAANAGNSYTPFSAQANYANPQFNSMGVGALGTQSNYSAPGFSSMGIGSQQVGYNGPQFQHMGLGASMTGTQAYNDPATAASYMNPYMRNVVDYQSQEAIRNYQKTLPQEQAAAVQKGAFGGNRQAINQSEMQRNLNTQLAGIAATGASNAYQQGAQQFTSDQGRSLASQQSNQQALLAAQGQGLQQNLAGNQQNFQNAQLGLQANLANQQAGLTAQGQGLQQNLAANQYGLNSAQNAAQFDMQSQLANQQAGLTAQGQGLQQNLAANQQNVTNAQNASNYGLQAQQLNAQQGQYQAGLGLQGLQTALSGQAQVGNLANQNYNQQLGIADAQMRAGTQQQATNQSQLNTQYQQYADQLNHPYKQLSFMQGIVQGLPMSQSASSMYQAPPSGASSLASLGLGAYGLSGLLKKEGGIVKGYAGGGLTNQMQMLSTANNLPDEALAKSGAVPPYMKQGIMQQRGMLRTAMPGQPQAPGVEGLPAPNMEFADGGIVGYSGADESYVQPRAPFGRRAPMDMRSALVGPYSTQSGAPVSTDPAALAAQNAGWTVNTQGEPVLYSELLKGAAPLAEPPIPPVAAAQTGAGGAQSSAPARGAGVAALARPALETYDGEKPESLDAIAAKYRKMLRDEEANNPAYADLDKMKAKAEAREGKAKEFEETTPYMMALRAAAELAKPGRGTIAAAGAAFGASGEEYSAREKSLDNMRDKADEMGLKALMAKDALHKGDADAARHILQTAENSRTKYDEGRRRSVENKNTLNTQMYGDDKRAQTTLQAAGIAAAARQNALAGALKDNTLAQKMLHDTETQVLRELAADQKANPAKYRDKDIPALARAEALARLSKDPNYVAVAKRAGIGALEVGQSTNMVGSLPPGAQVAGSL